MVAMAAQIFRASALFQALILDHTEDEETALHYASWVSLLQRQR